MKNWRTEIEKLRKIYPEPSNDKRIRESRKRQRLNDHLELLCKAKAFDLYLAQNRSNEVNHNSDNENERQKSK